MSAITSFQKIGRSRRAQRAASTSSTLCTRAASLHKQRGEFDPGNGRDDTKPRWQCGRTYTVRCKRSGRE
jgi:hypothetical protein